jgi:heme/copper-type cytochrome/quinol oxidase subunit 2
LGDIVGAQIVTVPVAVPQQQAWDGFVRVVAGLVTVFILLYIGFVYMVRKYVEE